MRDLIGIAVASASLCLLIGAAPDRVVLTGNTSPKAQPQFDRGPVPPSQRISGMRVIAKLSPDRQAELNRVTAAQQNPASPEYHHWLTPEQYADRYGWSEKEIGRITDWLKMQGFTIEATASARNSITFSGTAAQVEAAFQIKLHRFVIDSQPHFANTSDPSVPADLAPLIQSVEGLNDFRPAPGESRDEP